MSKKVDRNLLERIFSDAYVVDIDFSEWDKRICFLVLADRYEAWSDRSPAVLIEFYNVREFSCRMPQPEIGFDEPEKHLQWKIDDFEI